MGRGLRAAGWACASLIAFAGPSPAQTSDAFAGFTGVTFQYYDVVGTDAASIERALRKARPTDPADGKRVDALTQTWLRWSWRVAGDTCMLDQATLTFSATVQLPRLARRASLPAALVKKWDAYIVALEAHEAQHVRFAFDAQPELSAAIKTATCETANDAAKAVLATVQQRDIELDRRTAHGERDNAHF